MSEVANLSIKIAADVKDAMKGLEDTQKKMQKLSDGLGTAGKSMTKYVTGPMVAMGVGMFGLASKTGDYADRILDLNAITGMSTDSIQEWSHVADIAGVSNEAVTNAVSGLVRRLPQLEEEGGKATEGMEKLGLSYDELSKLSPDEQIDTLMYALSEMEDPLERNAIGSQLFGGAWQDIAPILGMGADEIANTRDQAHELGAVMGGEALNDANNFRIEMEELKTEFMATGREIASELIPLLRDVFLPIIRDQIIPMIENFANRIQDLITWFKGLSGSQQENILKWAGLLAALGPVLLILSKLVKGIMAVVKVAKLLSVAVAALFSPFGLIVAAIAAVIAIGVALWRNWDTIIAKARELHQRVQTSVQNMVTAVVGFFTNLGARAREIFSAMVAAVVNFFRNMFNSARNIANNMRNAITNIFNTFSNIVRNVFSRVSNAVRTGMTSAFRVITGFFSRFKNAGRNIISNIAEGIKGAVSMVTDAVGGVMSKARDLLPFSPPKDKSSPLADIHKNGIGEQIAKGIYDGEREVDNAMKDILGTGTSVNANVNHQQGDGARNVVINIDRIDNHSDSDIPRIMEQSAWLMSRQEGRLSGA